MRLRTKRRIKRFLGKALAVLLLISSLIFAYFQNKVIETIVVIALFYIYRFLFRKQWHANSLYLCFCITAIVLLIIINMESKLSISILFLIIITFILTTISYLVSDYIDNKVLVNHYEKKMSLLNNKCIENLTEEEMIKLFPNIKESIIKIVYEYLHRDISAEDFAYKHNLSSQSIYKYVKKVKDAYKDLNRNV